MQARSWEGHCREEDVPRLALLLPAAGGLRLLPPLSPRLTAAKLGRTIEATLLELEAAEAGGESAAGPVLPAVPLPGLQPVDWQR